MSVQASTIIDFVAGRLDREAARDVERASKFDARLATAISDARALNARMQARLAIIAPGQGNKTCRSQPNH